jgi:uncharacterized protein involved in tolerance to divalent cations
MIFVYSTAPTKDEAEKLAALILEAKLAACVNMWPMSSLSVNGSWASLGKN